MDTENIVNLDEHRPHITGEAKCLTCDHKWAAVAPIGAVELCCPKCNTWKGVFTGMTAPKTVWECGCGNQHFYLDPYGPMCSRCGLRQEGWGIK